MRRRSDPDDAGGNVPGAAGPPQPARSGHTRLSTGQRIAAWLSVAVVAILVIAVVGVYFVYRSDYQSIKRIDVQAIVGSKQPPKLNNAENILLIGSDTRVGQGGVGGAADSGCDCSDTLMVLHISPGHHEVTVMSIPRDSMVPVEACPASDGTPGQQAAPGELERINSTLAYGGPACTFKVVEDQTGIHLDHFIQLDFTGFINVVNDLGGVNVCLPFNVDDSMSGLNLSAGTHHIDGLTALQFWRTREDIGTGSDPQRIQRDQYLMAALVQGMMNSGLLHSPTKIFSIVRDAAAAMTTDTGLDENAMLQIAESLPGLTAKNVQFVTVPNIPYVGDPSAELSWEQPQANELFSAIQNDVTLPATTPGKATPTPTPALDVAPSQVKVDVENGSGQAGIASTTGSQLSGLGFQVVETGDASNFSYSDSVIEYAASSDMSAVNTLKAEIPGAQTEQNSALTPGTLQLIIGSNFSGLSSSSSSASPSPTSSPGSSVSSVAQSDGAISADVAICNDQGAFNGPNSP